MNVARYDYPSQFSDLDALTAQLRTMLEQGEYVLSRQVSEFERALADYLGCRHVIGVHCGTDALLLALIGLGIGAGDEVITQANTFHATVSAICWTGATPVLVDADAASMAMDATAIEAVCTDRTKALLPVHLYGRPAPMRAIQAVAERRGLSVVEDAAQAIGASYDGRRVGALGAAGCFSFHPSKNLAAAGDAGAIATDSDELAADLRVRRGLGQAGANDHVLVGVNSKLNALQAAVLSHKLPRLDEWSQARRRIAARYRAALGDLPLEFQDEDPQGTHVYHLFQVRTSERDDLQAHLAGRGVDAIVRYPVPVHLQPAFADRGWRAGQFPVAERQAREILALPTRPNLTEAEQEHVVGSVRSFFKANAT